MKRIIYVILAVVCLPFGGLRAQHAYFPEEGVIHYEKTIHARNLMKRYINSLQEGDFQRRMMSDMINRMNETAVLKKKLSFKGAEMNYEPIKEDTNPMMGRLLSMDMLDYQTTIYQNLDSKESQSIFELAGSNIFVKDELIDVKWKITNEYREIAGYECRRANGIVLDSVYVVAFYTDQIPLSAGPGTIHGLPGMILGFVVPDQHFNIYATKVEFSTPTIKTNVAGRRDTPMTREDMRGKIRESSFGQWMSGAQLDLLLAAMQL